MYGSLSLVLLFLSSLLAGCASTPVWRSAAFGPEKPAPTLLAAAVYDFGSEESAIDITSVHNTARMVASAIMGIKALEATADTVHARATDFLRQQGFQLETDLARSKKITEDGMIGGDYRRVAPDTVPRPFGEFMLFGPGSKASIAERLKTGRERECYASIKVMFGSRGSSLENGVRCALWFQVLDQSGTLVFEGKASGAADFRNAPNQVMLDAFDRALAAMQKVVVKA